MPRHVVVREYRPTDEAAILALAPRLTEGVAPWRDPRAVLEAVIAWVGASVGQAHADGRAVFVAEVQGVLAGFVSVGEREHFTGAVDGYVGELVVSGSCARLGVGTRLMARAEEWARARGHAHLTLETGAANAAARTFYAALGYEDEDVRLTKRL